MHLSLGIEPAAAADGLVQILVRSTTGCAAIWMRRGTEADLEGTEVSLTIRQSEHAGMGACVAHSCWLQGVHSPIGAPMIAWEMERLNAVNRALYAKLLAVMVSTHARLGAESCLRVIKCT